MFKVNIFSIYALLFIILTSSHADKFRDDIVDRLGYTGLEDFQSLAKEYKKKCEKNEAKACFDLGNLYFHHLGVPYDHKKAIKLYLKACKYGFGESCYKLSHMYISTFHVSERERYELLKKSCEYGYSDGCYELASDYFNSQNKNIKREGWRLFIKACNLGSSRACGFLGASYEFGIGARQDLSIAKEYYGKSCDLGRQEACKNYARLNMLGY